MFEIILAFRFTHVINLEYYSDLVAILARLVGDELVGARERLLVVRTVLAILAGAGDALNVDPAKFHTYLYVSMLGVHAGKHSRVKTTKVANSLWQLIK